MKNDLSYLFTMKKLPGISAISSIFTSTVFIEKEKEYFSGGVQVPMQLTEAKQKLLVKEELVGN